MDRIFKYVYLCVYIYVCIYRYCCCCCNWCMPHAIAETSFDEILHLGSDFTPVAPLDWIFDDELYLRHGASPTS